MARNICWCYLYLNRFNRSRFGSDFFFSPISLVGLVLVGIGMGLANGHLVALAILAAPDGQSLLRAHLFKPCEHLAPVLVLQLRVCLPTPRVLRMPA